MARLPQVGGDSGNWGDILNEYLSQSLASDGSLKPNTVDSNQLKASNTPSTGTLLGWDGTDLTWTAPATLSTVATSGSYSDLTNKPSIPTDSTLVHLTGAETISGNKDFTGSLTQNGNAIVTTVDGRLSDTRTPTDNTVSSAKIQDGAVTTAKIPDGAITNAKLATNVQTMMSDTQTAASNAATSATNAGNSASNAHTSEVNAANSATAAASSATDANNTVQTGSFLYTASTDVSGTISLASVGQNSIIHFRLVGNLTISALPTSPKPGQTLTLVLYQDTTGSRSLTLPASVKKSYGIVLPLTTTASAVDMVHILYDGVQWWATLAAQAGA